MNLDIKNNLEKILKGEYIVRYGCALRKNILANNILEYKCNICGICSWNETKISLEIDHIDGDNFNNKKENLRFLCPNCHSQTDNYKGKRRQDKKYSSVFDRKNEIISLYEEGKSIHSIIQKLNLNIGGNYTSIYKIFKENNIEIHQKKYKPIIKKQIEVINKTQRIEEKLKEIDNRINIIMNSDIDFSKRGWGVKVGKIFNVSPVSALKWVKYYMPEFAKNCFKHNK